MSRLASCPHCAGVVATRRSVITGLAAAAMVPTAASAAAATTERRLIPRRSWQLHCMMPPLKR